ncbi:AP endonuclease [Ophiobolus disseminans]|uniref:Apurinic-apyrimidinic endonuclease 1 n=1 Tax=Ophiobolus disseminans TaxID=1469910 RepID=A0A6A6ZF72_9PLEO|nr:AP endonuclease [Ophiobolus disseminans]
MARKLTDVPSDSSLSPVPDDPKVEAPTPAKAAPKGKKRKTEALSSEEETEEKVTKKKTRPRKKKQQEAAAPLAERSTGTKLIAGAHVSTAGGVHNAVANLIYIGGNAFAFFFKNQRKWINPELDPEFARLFIAGCKEHGIDVAKCCLPHGSYLVNLAHPDPVRKKQAYDSFLDDLTRCHTLGIKLYNFHPGNANATTRNEGVSTIAENINKAHRDPASGDVIAVLETMASQGNTIGGTFRDIADIIALVNDKSRIGVCLDTCHVFAAGYDLRTPEAYAASMAEFDKVIGLEYLKALHINDSKAPLDSKRDLHARIGTGFLGLRSFHNIVNDERLHGLPMVLETPTDGLDENGKKTEDKSIWAREIKLLESLVGMDVESEEFRTLERDLAKEGTEERDRLAEQVERKKKKDAKAKAKDAKGKKGKKKVETEDEEDEEDEE